MSSPRAQPHEQQPGETLDEWAKRRAQELVGAGYGIYLFAPDFPLDEMHRPALEGDERISHRLYVGQRFLEEGKMRYGMFVTTEDPRCPKCEDRDFKF